MESSYYKTLKTSRGLEYCYYRSIALCSNVDLEEPRLPTLLFLHGFPTTSRVWQHQATYFSERGFSLVIPDMLGFGETSKPVNPEDYRSSLVCQDILDILDAEGICDRIVAVGHDLGSKIVSRLANLHGERFLGHAFLAVSYCPPRPMSTIAETARRTKNMCGYELCGHYIFLAENGAEDLIESHLDSFYSIIFSDDPKIWATDVGPLHALKTWPEADRRTSALACICKEETEVWRETFKRGKFAAPLCWYKALVNGACADDDKLVPLEKYRIEQPIFLAAANHDYIAQSMLSIAVTNYHCKNATIRQFFHGHWLMMSAPSEVNAALFSWIMDIV